MYVYVNKNIFWLTLASYHIPSKVYYDYSHYYEEKPASLFPKSLNEELLALALSAFGQKVQE